MSKKSVISLLILIATNLLLAAWFVLHNDIVYGFSGDIARDMYLLERTAIKKIQLIGAHSGGIPGLFHGPAWIYLNLPAFVISGGNPVSVGWFWVLLSISTLGITYFVANKLFNQTTAWLSVLLLSVFLIESTKELINPFGAVILFPLFFYSFYKYLSQPNVRDLLVSLLSVGFMIQFQVAFGGPIFILMMILLVHTIYKKKKWSHILALCILVIPFSTYILFELRNQFFQTNSLIKYISGTEDFAKQPFHLILLSRLKGILYEGLYIFKNVPAWLSIGCVAIFAYFINTNKDSIKHKKIYNLFLFFYIGYWFIMLLYSGIVFNYYYWPFLPVVVMLFSSTYQFINRKIFIILFTILYTFTFITGYKSTVMKAKMYIGQNVDSWLLNKEIAEKVFENAPQAFGYFIYSPDLHATGTKYAMYYVQKNSENKKGELFVKKPVTYIIYAPELGGQQNENSKWWKENMVKISNKPTSVEKLPNGFVIEKYILSDKEVTIPTDPGIVNQFDLYSIK